MQDMNITFTDSVKTATFDNADGSIKINLEWWESLDNDYKALIIAHELEALAAWRRTRFNRPADYAINADLQAYSVSPRDCAIGGEEDSNWT